MQHEGHLLSLAQLFKTSCYDAMMRQTLHQYSKADWTTAVGRCYYIRSIYNLIVHDIDVVLVCQALILDARSFGLERSPDRLQKLAGPGEYWCRKQDYECVSIYPGCYIKVTAGWAQRRRVDAEQATNLIKPGMTT